MAGSPLMGEVFQELAPPNQRMKPTMLSRFVLRRFSPSRFCAKFRFTVSAALRLMRKPLCVQNGGFS